MFSSNKKSDPPPESIRDEDLPETRPLLKSGPVETAIERSRSDYANYNKSTERLAGERIIALETALQKISGEYANFRHAIANRFSVLDFYLNFAHRIVKDADLRDPVVRTQLIEFLDNAVFSAAGFRQMLSAASKPHCSESEIPKSKAGHLKIGEYVERSITRLTAGRQIPCKILNNLTDETIIADESSLDVILEEIINNAQKYASRPTSAYASVPDSAPDCAPPSSRPSAPPSSRQTPPLNLSVSLSVENEKAVICIEDNGPGFDMYDPGQIENFFRPGIRGRNTRNIPGNGTGLAQCRKICGYFKGTLTAMNRPTGRGAMFILSFPLLPAK